MPRIAQREAFRCFGNLFQRAIKFGIKIIRGIIAVLCVPCQAVVCLNTEEQELVIVRLEVVGLARQEPHPVSVRRRV